MAYGEQADSHHHTRLIGIHNPSIVTFWPAAYGPSCIL